MRALDGAVFDNSHQLHGHGDNERWTMAADPAGLPRPGTGSGRRGVSQLSTRRFSAGEANVGSRGGLFALIALFAHHFFSCSVAGKPLAATTPAGCAKNAGLNGPCIEWTKVCMLTVKPCFLSFGWG
jgi:hypothetical protein